MSYTRVNWQNSPSTSTPLSAENLNKMDAGIKQNADDIETLQQHTYDEELDGSSTNAPQTKAVYEAIQGIDIETDTTLSVSGKAADAAATGEAIANVKSAIDALKITDTASGAIASFPDGAAMPMEGLTVELEPIQAGSGDPSPDNVRPITGRDEVTVTRTGKNLLDANTALPSIGFATEPDGSFYCATATMVLSKTLWENTTHYTGSITLTYLYKYNSAESQGVRFKFIYTDGTSVEQYASPSPIYVRKTIISDSNKTLARIVGSYGSGGTKTWIKDVQLELGSTATEYEPYDGQSATIALGQTVYGGTVDVTEGEMRVEWKSVDMGTLNWRNSGGNKLFYTDGVASEIRKSASNAELFSWGITSIGLDGKSYNSITQTTPYSICVSTSGNILATLDTDQAYSDANAFKAAMSGVQLCYELATPLEITLDPVTLSTLKGQNNVWSDGDSVAVDYVADPKLYIARLTEPDADMVADANIVSGKYFMVGNSLYLATANIASGAAIVPGVNCTRTNLAAALNAINA